MIVIAVIGALGQQGMVSPAVVLFLVAEVAAFVLFVALVGTRVLRGYASRLGDIDAPNLLALAVVVCLGLAALASSIGLAPIIGAFLAGLVLGESVDARRLTDIALPIYRLLVPFFFVITGMHVDPSLLWDPVVATLAGAVTVVAIVSKLLGGLLGALGLGMRSALIIGVGMIPRGEIGFVVVAMGRSLGVLPEQVVSVVIVMSVVTTLVVPPVLAALFRGAELPLRLRRPDRPWPALLTLPGGATDRDFGAAGRLPGLGSNHRRPPRHDTASRS